MKVRPSVKIALGFAVFSAALYGGVIGITGYRLSQLQFPSLRPGRVTLLFVNPEDGYRIVVSNRVAQLFIGEKGEFGGVDIEKADSSGENRRRIPIKEMLDTMNGEADKSGEYVMSLNGITREDWPSVEHIWTAEKMAQALDGDASLAADLERDLGTKLDGTAPDFLNLEAMANGIIIDFPVELQTPTGEKLVARARMPYRTTLMRSLSNEVEKAGASATPEQIQGLYQQLVSQRGREPNPEFQRELRSLIGPDRAKQMAEKPQALLSNVRTVANESVVRNASFESVGEGRNRTYNVRLSLTSEGRDRLWKISRERKGFQLLFIVDGIAIGAPVISHEIWQQEVLISGLTDEQLARDAVDTINQICQAGGCAK